MFASILGEDGESEHDVKLHNFVLLLVICYLLLTEEYDNLILSSFSAFWNNLVWKLLSVLLNGCSWIIISKFIYKVYDCVHFCKQHCSSNKITEGLFLLLTWVQQNSTGQQTACY